jgi:predicted MFS family arabinose efflux permease
MRPPHGLPLPSDTTQNPTAKRPGRWPAEADFWRLWLVGALQFCIRWMDILVFGIFTYQATGSAFMVTMLMMLRILPMALFGAFMGAAADRFEGRTILTITITVSLVTSAILALLAFTGLLAVWHIAVGSFVGGVIWSMDLPLRRLMVGRVVGTAHMATAMALDAGSSNASRMIGPAVGGIVFATWGIGGCFIVGIVIYVIAIGLALGVRYRNPLREHAHGAFLGNIAAAIKVSVRDPGLVGYFAVTIIFNLFAWPIISLVPVIGQDFLHLSERGIGIFASMDGAGAILGALAIVYFAPPALYARLYVASVVVNLFALTAMSLLPDARLAGTALLFAGSANAVFGIMQSTLIFRIVKPEMRGLMLGLLTVAIGTGPIGFVQTGLLADAIGTQYAIVITACEGLLALALTWRWWRRIGEEQV